MGNEDVVVNKNIDENQDYKSAIVGIDLMKQGVENLTIGDNTNTDKDNDRVDFVQVLPMEVIEEIFIYLSPKELAACSTISVAWREAVNSNKVWGRLCDKKKWKDEFEGQYSHFCYAFRQFRQGGHTSDSFSQICQKRLLYNQHSCLLRNWREGKYMLHKIHSKTQPFLQMFEPISCDDNYIVIQEKDSKFSVNGTLGVWTLKGKPKKICELDLPSKVHSAESVGFDFGTIAVAQTWIIIVYQLKDQTFEKTYEKTDLADLEPKSRLPKEIKRMAPYLKVTQDYIICVPNHSHSTVDFIPIFFWDRITGDLKHTLPFDSMYYQITNAIWFKDSCYLSLTNKKKKSYQVVEFGIKSATWETFAQSVTVEVEQVVVGEKYVLAVTKTSNAAFREVYSRHEMPSKELWLWDRATGSALKTFEAQGKGFQFVGDNLMYFDSTKVAVINPRSPNICSEFEVSGTICSIRATSYPSIIALIKTSCYIEVWDWGLGQRLYTITSEPTYGSQLWCDKRTIITYHSAESASGGGVLFAAFW